MNNDIVFFEGDGVKVTSSLLILLSSRYYIKEINGVFISKEQNFRRYPIFAAIVFVILALTIGHWSLWFLTVGCIAWAVLMRTQYILRIKVGLGEIRPLKSTNRGELEIIKEAIERAMFEVG